MKILIILTTLYSSLASACPTGFCKMTGGMKIYSCKILTKDDGSYADVLVSALSPNEAQIEALNSERSIKKRNGVLVIQIVADPTSQAQISQPIISAVECKLQL